MKRTEGGVALFVALLVVAIATVLIAGLLDQGQIALARTRATLRATQADELGRGLEAFALDVLRRDDALKADVDSSGDLWSQPLPQTPVPGGSISGRLIDLNGRFNLNSLLVAGQIDREVALPRLQRLLGALELNPQIAEAIADWIDADQAPTSGGAEDTYYLSQPLAYRTANAPMVDVTELRRIRGIDEEAYAKLAPLVVALPPDAPLNINTAAMEQLLSLDPRITRDVARRLGNEHGQTWTSLQDFVKALNDLGIIIDASSPNLRGVGVKSTWFRSRAIIDLDGIPLTREALIVRDRQGPRVVARWAGPRE